MVDKAPLPAEEVPRFATELDRNGGVSEFRPPVLARQVVLAIVRQLEVTP